MMELFNPPMNSRAAETARKCLLALFLSLGAICFIRAWFPGGEVWPEILLLLLAIGVVFSGLRRELPFQNILLAAAVIALLSSFASISSAVAGYPLNGPRLFGVRPDEIVRNLPWPQPLLWVVALLSSRGSARLILQRWRTLPGYGFWVIGLTALLTCVFWTGLEWSESSAGLLRAGELLFTSILLITLVTPVLISKHPSPAKPSCEPAMVWFSAAAVLAARCAAGVFSR
jgi:hypothetical protein